MHGYILGLSIFYYFGKNYNATLIHSTTIYCLNKLNYYLNNNNFEKKKFQKVMTSQLVYLKKFIYI